MTRQGSELMIEYNGFDQDVDKEDPEKDMENGEELIEAVGKDDVNEDPEPEKEHTDKLSLDKDIYSFTFYKFLVD